MKKNDIILIGIILLISVSAFGVLKFIQSQNEADSMVIIKDDGVIVKTFPFTERTEEVFYFDDGAEINVVVIKDGIVTVSEANCRDQICVKSQSISRSGEIIVCLPHKFTVEIFSESAEDHSLDSIAE